MEAIVEDDEVAELLDLLLGHLATNPLAGFLLGDAVAGNDAADANCFGRTDADDPREGHAPMETAVEEDGALEPLIAGLQEVAGHGGMDDVVDGLLVLLGGEEKCRLYPIKSNRI